MSAGRLIGLVLAGWVVAAFCIVALWWASVALFGKYEAWRGRRARRAHREGESR